MANPLRDMSVIMQGLVAAAIAVVLVLFARAFRAPQTT